METYNIDSTEPIEQILAECQTAIDNGDYPESYETKKNKRYELFGVKKFKQGLIKFNDQPSYHLNGTSLEDLQNYQEQSKDCEKKHILGGLASLALTAPIVFSDESVGVKLTAVGLCTALNLVLNAYPILVQKYNQNRINKVIEKKQRK